MAIPTTMPTTCPTYELRLEWTNGRVETVRAAADETILDAAGAADVALPFGCVTGACATCTGQLLEGELEHRRPPRALKERHLEDGYVLLCIAEPRANSRLRVGADVRTDLVANPWR